MSFTLMSLLRTRRVCQKITKLFSINAKGVQHLYHSKFTAKHFKTQLWLDNDVFSMQKW